MKESVKKSMKIFFTFILVLVCLSQPAFAEKVYPKATTSKGLAPYLYLPDNPTPAVIKINEAKQAWFEDRYQEACDLWREALNLRPNHPEGIWHDIGMCSMALNAYDDAILAYTNAIKMNPKEIASDYRERGNAYLKAGDNFNAQKDFARAAYLDKYGSGSSPKKKSVNNAKKELPKTIPMNRHNTVSDDPASSGKISQIYSKITDYFRNWTNMKTLKLLILLMLVFFAVALFLIR